MNDSLLEVISTRGNMSVAEFDTAYDRLALQTTDESLSFARRRTLSALDALGHCETDWGRQRLFACSPFLARLPTAGCPRVVLAGARVTQTVIQVKNYAKTHPDVADFSIEIQPQGLPDIVTLEAADESTLAECANICHVPLSGHLPVAWTLTNASGQLANYEDTFAWKPDAPLNWRLRIFDPYSRLFRRADDPRVAELLSSEPRLTEHTHPATQQCDYRWTNDGFYALVTRDWGRWLSLYAARESAILYDARRQRLAVPSSVPLPRLLARAATLCSGRAPHADTHVNQRVYDSVSITLAELIARKCGQSCKPANLGRSSDRA